MRQDNDASETPPKATPQYRMAEHVLALLQRHPLLEPLQAAGEPVLVSCHNDAIWAQAISAGGGAYELEARIESERWWLPQRSGRAAAIAEELAIKLRQQWDAREGAAG